MGGEVASEAMELSEALRRYLEASGETQTDLAARLGVDQSTISRALAGNYGRDGWRAAMTALGLTRIVRNIDGDYIAPDLDILVDMLGDEIAKEAETAGPDRIGEVRDLQKAIADLQGADG